MGRRVEAGQVTGQPGRLLGHEDPYDIWAKLNWEAHRFLALRAEGPPMDIDGMVYLLQNACISAVAAVEWLEKGGKRAARVAGRAWDADAFSAAVATELPDLLLARAIANTLKHGSYRDEGWGDAEIRLVPIFTQDQRERLEAERGTVVFEELFADLAAGADFEISFARAGDDGSLAADRFVMSMADGTLRLIDAVTIEPERFSAAPTRSA